MKSELFSRFDPSSKSNDNFRTDLNMMLGFDWKDISLVLDSIPEYLKSDIPNKDKRIVDDISKKTKLTNNQVQRLMHFGTFFSTMYSEPEIQKDNPEQWTTDLVELRLLDDDNSQKFLKFSTKIIENISSEVSELSKNKEYKRGLVPVLSSLGATVEIRAVQKNEFELGDPIKDYQPNIIGIQPVITIKLRLSGDIKDPVVFQTTPDKLKLIIDALNSTIKDCEHFTNNIDCSKLLKS